MSLGSVKALVPTASHVVCTGAVLLSITACQQQPPQIIINANSSADKTNSFTATETTTSNSRSAQIENQPPAVIAVAPVATAPSKPVPAAAPPTTQQVCRVNDPNDSYVNLRQSPNGALIGPVVNGTTVQITGYQSDTQGRDWAAVFTQNKRVGFMFRSMISCG